MKNIIYCLMVVAMVFLASCNPIDDRDSLGPMATLDQIKLTAINTTTPNGKKGNQFVVNNATPQYGGQWNLLVKRSNNVTDTVTLPFIGKFTFVFSATTDGGIVKDSVLVEVDTIDHPTNPMYTFLAGSGAAGKTWVWAFDNPKSLVTGNQPGPGNGPWGNGAFGNDTMPTWWGSTAQIQSSGQWNDKITFDLNGGANFTLITGNTDLTDWVEPDGTYHGVFEFDTSKPILDSKGNVWSQGTLAIKGGQFVTITRGYSPNEPSSSATPKIPVYTFQIVRLSTDELVLCYNTTNTGEGWYWIFKPEGYTFP
jgi:hypothetical protein